MPEKFERERHLVQELIATLRYPGYVEYRNPLLDRGLETGVDVTALIGGDRIGFQVTEYDGGEGSPEIGAGRMRAHERTLIREAGPMGVYSGLGSPHFERSFQARVAAKVAKSQRYAFSDFDEVCLLVSANVPGAGLSTSVPSAPIGSDLLDEISADCLGYSKYTRAFLHVIMGDVIFAWRRAAGWQKVVDRRRKE